MVMMTTIIMMMIRTTVTMAIRIIVDYNNHDIEDNISYHEDRDSHNINMVIMTTTVTIGDKNICCNCDKDNC